MTATLTTEDVERWFEKFGQARPPHSEVNEFVWVDSFAAVTCPDGMILRIKVRGMEKPMDLFCNVIVATALLQAVKKCGAASDWLDGDENITIPTPGGSYRWRSES